MFGLGERWSFAAQAGKMLSIKPIVRVPADVAGKGLLVFVKRQM
jgi:hypothetical protein